MTTIHCAVVVGHSIQVVRVVYLVWSLGVRDHLQPVKRKLNQGMLFAPGNILAKPVFDAFN